MTAHRTIRSAASLAAALMIAGCSNDTAVPDAAPSSNRADAPAGASSAVTPTEKTPPKAEVPVPPGVVGPGCANYVVEVPSGPGALDGMGRDPVAVAIGNSPLLTTFSGSLMGHLNPEVNLVDAVDAGQFTVFAPTDEAFAKLPAGTVENLLKPENKDKLKEILLLHVVPGSVYAADVVKLKEAKTAGGKTVTISTDGGVKVGTATGLAKVVTTDIKAKNGVIHVIDAVILP